MLVLAASVGAVIGGGLIAWASRATPALTRSRRERLAMAAGLLVTGGAILLGLVGN